MGIADDSFVPILVQVQATILDDNATKPAPMIAYSVEFAFNVILLCALYRVSEVPIHYYNIIFLNGHWAGIGRLDQSILRPHRTGRLLYNFQFETFEVRSIAVRHGVRIIWIMTTYTYYRIA